MGRRYIAGISSENDKNIKWCIWMITFVSGTIDDNIGVRAIEIVGTGDGGDY